MRIMDEIAVTFNEKNRKDAGILNRGGWEREEFISFVKKLKTGKKREYVKKKSMKL
jgi:hypothetical protein